VVLEGHGPPSSFGAGYREIFDLGAWDAARVLVAPGQSGHPASPHYRDLIPHWLHGEYISLPYSPEAVAAAAVHTLTLAPLAPGG
jgi:penicillin amidase